MSQQQEEVLSLLKVKDEDIIKSATWYKKLLAAVNDLINHDFSQLLYILYKADVPEKKLKLLLEQNPGTNAADIICKLIVERELQKIQSRRQFQAKNNIADDDEERW